MKIRPGSIWRNIDTTSEDYQRLCMVMHINDNPDWNGDGEIELLYSNNTRHYGKVRRFMPGITHVLVKEAAHLVRPTPDLSNALAVMEADVIGELHNRILELSDDMAANGAQMLTWADIVITTRMPVLAVHLAAETLRKKGGA